MNRNNEDNDRSRFVSQPGEMLLLSPEGVIGQFDAMIAEAQRHMEEQQALIERCDREIEECEKKDAELRAILSKLEREIAQTKRNEKKYGRLPGKKIKGLPSAIAPGSGGYGSLPIAHTLPGTPRL